MADDFFTDLENTKPYLKIAMEGFAGCGKTYTMALVAAGLHKRIGSTKPIVCFDTEKAAKFLKGFFRDQEIKVLHRESRSLADLKESMDRCQAGLSDILMIDSITHVWENFLAAYQQRTRRSRLEFQDWGPIKATWKREFSEPFVQHGYHTLMTGRAGYEYETEINADTGKREIYKSGIKMKVEGETAYEPDILVLMSRFEQVLADKKEVWREATVIKDRSALIDGMTFKNPGYEQFAPAVDRILEEPVNRPAAREGDAAGLVQMDEDKRAWLKSRDIALEEIEGYLTSRYPGQSADAKKAKTDLLAAAFETRSWTAIQQKSPGELRAGLERIKIECEAEAAAIGDASRG